MIPSPTDEIKAIRRKLAARLDNDVHRIAEELRQHELASGRTYLSLPKREPVYHTQHNKALQNTGLPFITQFRMTCP